MNPPDFIVPPPGLIPTAPAPERTPPPAPERTVRAPVRPAPVPVPVSRPVPPGPRLPSGPPRPAPSPADEPPPAAVPVMAPPDGPAASAEQPAVPASPPVSEAPAGPTAWRLRGADGVEVRVSRATVLGRDPVVDSASGHAVVALADPARSVSKTHALVQVDAGRLLVTDLRSTNGVRIWPAGGEPADILPDAPTEVPDGATVLLGDLGLQAERVPEGTVVA